MRIVKLNYKSWKFYRLWLAIRIFKYLKIQKICAELKISDDWRMTIGNRGISKNAARV